MKKIILLTVGLALIAGCVSSSRLDPEGPYKGDAILYNADRTIASAYDLMHSFVKWEYENRASLGPQVKASADHVRRNAESWIGSAVSTRDIYALAPTAANRNSLESNLRMLRMALSEVTQYLTDTRKGD